MIFISLLLRAWMLHIAIFAVTVRTLADDLMIISRGDRALHNLPAAMDATFQHLSDLGGKLATSKSKLFATMRKHRSWLASHVWPHSGTLIPVVGNIRDLGSALSFTLARCTSYSKNRLFQAIATVLRIGKLPHSRDEKAKFFIASGHSRGLYGCPSSQVDIDPLAKYTSTVLDVNGPGNNQHRSRSMTSGTVHVSPYIDPFMAIYHDRVAAFRRFSAIFPEKSILVDKIYTAYKSKSYVEAHTAVDLQTLQPAPLPGDSGRSQ